MHPLPPTPDSADGRGRRTGEYPTLGWLCGLLGAWFAGGDPERDRERAVRGVWQAGRTLDPPPARHSVRDVIVVVPEEVSDPGRAAADRFVRWVRDRGAAALARPVAGGAAGPPEAVRSLDGAAARLGVPVIVLPDALEWSALAQAVGDERVRLARERARVPAEVLTRSRVRPGRPGGVQRLVSWLADEVGGGVTVTAGTGEPVAAAPAGAWEAVRPVAPVIARVAAGDVASAVVDAGPWEVRVLPLGEGTARPVLAVARARGAGPLPADAVTHAGGILPLLLRVEDAHAVERHARRALAAAGVGVLQMLMGGQLLLAQRTAAVVRPGLLDAEAGRVLIIAGRPDGRDAVVEECGEATAGRALVVRCPVYDTDVIVVAPAHDHAEGSWAAVSARLGEVVAARPDRCMGGSALLPLAAAAGAYREASHALAVARQLPERVMLHSPQTQLADVLDPRADAWAAAWLAPVLALPHHDRGSLLDTLRLVMEFGVSGASRISGRHRNTVTAARRRAEDLLGTRLDDVATRARLDLALRLVIRLPAGRSPGPPARLSEVLAAEPVRWWAQRWLAALDGDGRALRATLTAWIACNAGVRPAAARLGLHPGTVRDHLRAAGCLLRRDLMTSAGPHDLVLALLATDALPAVGDGGPGRPEH